MHWKEVPLPERMKDLPFDSRGFPIPYVIYWDKSGVPQFKINDEKKSQKCLLDRLCAICGQKLGDDMWLTGGAQSAFHERGAYFDTPMHHECGVYALKVCPYLASRNYNTLMPEEKFKNVDADPGMLFIDPTMDPTRPEVFIFIKFSDFTVRRIPKSPKRYVVPKRPYEAVEFWDKGQRIEVRMPKELQHLVKPQNTQNIIPWGKR